MSPKELRRRREQLRPAAADREETLSLALAEGAAWETPSEQLLALWETVNLDRERLCSASKYKAKRLGARKVKHFERVQGSGEVLSESEKTTFRALAARANYLSLDRPDIQYAAKELCRSFASPTRRDHTKLRRLVRYLLGRPRLVWTFN